MVTACFLPTIQTESIIKDCIFVCKHAGDKTLLMEPLNRLSNKYVEGDMDMAGNSNLHMSRSGKTDEFYTQLSTIEDE